MQQLMAKMAVKKNLWQKCRELSYTALIHLYYKLPAAMYDHEEHYK